MYFLENDVKEDLATHLPYYYCEDGLWRKTEDGFFGRGRMKEVLIIKRLVMMAALYIIDTSS